ncbi:corticoliberin-like [Pseudonaja textilis]|uniref:Corticoliberin-like n=1 Tax=Pseudonaja textilis TaxID=8673 RepID=A0A670ZAU3_PSETE|nr:corticoliberin-like [Pseudonaja textilis]
MAFKISAGLLVLLLFLPGTSCLPLAQLLPINDVVWEPAWLNPSTWRDPSLGPLPSSGAGIFPASSSPRSCPGTGDRSQPRRPARSAFSNQRRDSRPNSLDLTFHLLREFLKMAREEKMSQQARNNKILLHNLGK